MQDGFVHTLRQMSDPVVSMSAYVWDLRAQLEAELRTLSALQRLIEPRGIGAAGGTAAWREQVQHHLHELAVMNTNIRDVIAEASNSVAGAPGASSVPARPVEPA